MRRQQPPASVGLADAEHAEVWMGYSLQSGLTCIDL